MKTSYRGIIMFQSTLLRKERQNGLSVDSVLLGVSIHAPTKGATIMCSFFGWLHDVSIHAPTKGATFKIIDYKRSFYVSIHAPTKGATAVRTAKPTYQSVSIHAPTKGATSAWWCLYLKYRSFNPRSYERSDVHLQLSCRPSDQFQSTLLRKERQNYRHQIVG